jgi:hypothetical protein
MHKITRAILAIFNAAHQAAALASLRVRAFLVDLHVKSLKAMVASAEARVRRFSNLAAYHRTQAYNAQIIAGNAAHAANQVLTKARTEADSHGATLD